LVVGFAQRVVNRVVGIALEIFWLFADQLLHARGEIYGFNLFDLTDGCSIKNQEVRHFYTGRKCVREFWKV